MTLRETATRTLAEALEAMWDANPVGIDNDAMPAALLDASPTLARWLELGAAWDAVEAALPEGWWFGGCQRYGGAWSAAAWGPAPDWPKAAEMGSDPIAALVALAEALREVPR